MKKVGASKIGAHFNDFDFEQIGKMNFKITE
jgi:hypothetical protein